MTEWLLLALFVVLIVVCGGFVAAEFAFVTVDRSTVERAAEDGDRGAMGVRTELQGRSTQLSGAQLASRSPISPSGFSRSRPSPDLSTVHSKFARTALVSPLCRPGCAGAALGPRSEHATRSASSPGSTSSRLRRPSRTNGSTDHHPGQAATIAGSVASKEPAKWTGSVVSVVTAMRCGTKATRRIACTTDGSSNNGLRLATGQTSDTAAAGPVGSITAGSTWQASGCGRESVAQAASQLWGLSSRQRTAAAATTPSGRSGRSASPTRTSAHGDGTSQSDRTVRVTSRRSRHRSATDGRPQNQYPL